MRVGAGWVGMVPFHDMGTGWGGKMGIYRSSQLRWMANAMAQASQESDRLIEEAARSDGIEAASRMGLVWQT